MAMRATMPRPPLLSVNNLPRVIAIAIAPSRHRAIAAAIGFGDLFAVARRFRAFAEHQLLGTRRPPRRLVFDARSLLQARTSS